MAVLDMSGLGGKVAVVTGASSGLGVRFAAAARETSRHLQPLPQAAYASSKAAITGLTRHLAEQWTGRQGDLDELAATLVWLAGAGAGYVTGQTVVVDGLLIG